MRNAGFNGSKLGSAESLEVQVSFVTKVSPSNVSVAFEVVLLVDVELTIVLC